MMPFLINIITCTQVMGSKGPKSTKHIKYQENPKYRTWGYCLKQSRNYTTILKN